MGAANLVSPNKSTQESTPLTAMVSDGPTYLSHCNGVCQDKEDKELTHRTLSTEGVPDR